MDIAVCVLPAIAMREKPSHKKEITSQLLFGESMQVLKAKEKWFYIRSLHDDYEGWIRNNQVQRVEENIPGEKILAAAMVNVITTSDGPMLIPAASTLWGFSGRSGKIGDLSYQFDGEMIQPSAGPVSEKDLVNFATGWLNAPYLWGGRTVFGVDCSGFVQLVYKMMGIGIMRDARLQVGQGIAVADVSETHCGDLAFFHNHRGKIVHVGMLLHDQRIIHASGKVRIDKLDKEGIIMADTGKKSHHLAEIRRFF
jgi:cell wall-associated NlpC family hydrolase